MEVGSWGVSRNSQRPVAMRGLSGWAAAWRLLSALRRAVPCVRPSLAQPRGLSGWADTGVCPYIPERYRVGVARIIRMGRHRDLPLQSERERQGIGGCAGAIRMGRHRGLPLQPERERQGIGGCAGAIRMGRHRGPPLQSGWLAFVSLTETSSPATLTHVYETAYG